MIRTIKAASTLPMLLERGDNKHRPTLENRVAYQYETDGDILGHLNASTKNCITLNWLTDAIEARDAPSAVLDVGCAYGNMMLMLNARLGKPEDVEFVGVDLFEDGLAYPSMFAQEVAGYSNCSYRHADLSRALPFPDESFNAVNLGDVIEHMEAPDKAMGEIARVLKPGGIAIISTPLKGGLFKRFAPIANAFTRGSLYKKYYSGKSTQLDENGQPIMETHVGHDHVSEMTFGQLKSLLESSGLRCQKVQPMTVMSGSKWFDKHLFITSGLVFLEAIHQVLKLKSWAHSVMILARKA